MQAVARNLKGGAWDSSEDSKEEGMGRVAIFPSPHEVQEQN